MDYNDGIALAIALDFFMGDAFFRALDQRREQKNQVAVQHFLSRNRTKDRPCKARWKAGDRCGAINAVIAPGSIFSYAT